MEVNTTDPKLTVEEKPCITIFGSVRPKFNEREYQTAYELGKLLARSGFLVCNGGYGGIMEASARGAKDFGGKTIGIVCEQLGTQANLYIDDKIIVKTHAERLFTLVETGAAYVVLKGGTGTLLELALVWENVNKRLMAEKPIICLGDFWKPVIDLMSNEFAFERSGFVTECVSIAKTPRECAGILVKCKF